MQITKGAISVGKLTDELPQGIDRGIKLLLKSGFPTTAIQSTVQRDVGPLSGRRDAIGFVREAIDVGHQPQMRCSKHIPVCGCRNQTSDLAYAMIDCDMPLEIGRIGNSERAASSIIKRPRDVVSSCTDTRRRQLGPATVSYSGLASSRGLPCAL